MLNRIERLVNPPLSRNEIGRRRQAAKVLAEGVGREVDHIRQILLFGSLSKGKGRYNSDVDLLVISDDIETLFRGRNKIYAELCEVLGRNRRTLDLDPGLDFQLQLVLDQFLERNYHISAEGFKVFMSFYNSYMDGAVLLYERPE